MDKTEREIKITAKYIPLLAEFVAKQDRYYINALKVEPHPDGGILLVATDGHTLMVVHDTEGTTNGEWLCALPTKIVQACAKRGRKNDIFSKPKHLHFIGEVGYVMSGEGDPRQIGQLHIETAYCKIIDAKFPDWRKAVPRKPKALNRTCVNITYLARLLKLTKLGDYKYQEGVQLFQENSRGAVIVRPIGVPEMMVLVMPMYDDSIAQAIPSWLNLPQHQERKAA
jgi:hypothetical protein